MQVLSVSFLKKNAKLLLGRAGVVRRYDATVGMFAWCER